MTNIPILKDHDYHEEVGHMSFGDDGMLVEFSEGNEVLPEQMFMMFGNCGYQVIEVVTYPEEGKMRIKKARINEFSVTWRLN